MILTLQIIACCLLILLGAFFAGSETGVYRLSRFRLRLGIEQKRPLHSLLGNVMEDSDGLIFSMLIGNNLVHYIVTSIITLMLLKTTLSQQSVQLYATLIMSPVLFIFSEVIPKNLYYYHSDVIMPRLAAVTWFFHKLFKCSGAVWLLKSITRLTGKRLAGETSSSIPISFGSSAHIKQIIRETHDEGLLSSVQNDMLNRLINLSKISVSSVMIPLAKTKMVDINSDRKHLLHLLNKYNYTRYPVYKKHRANIVGFVNIYEVLAMEDLQSCDLSGSGFARPIARFSGSLSVSDVIEKMRNKNHKIVLVTHGYSQSGKVSGILTMKDLVEEITGELAEW